MLPLFFVQGKVSSRRQTALQVQGARNAGRVVQDLVLVVLGIQVGVVPGWG